jgi:cysteine desulfurase/selenocysteine lyase
MTLAELHADESLRRHEFPVVAEKVYLAHAGVCPLPRRVAAAIEKYSLESTRGDQEAVLPDLTLRPTRELAARLLGAQPEEIAFVGPTTLALSFVAAGLKFKKGDNVLIYFDDYPSNVYPWMSLAERGVEVRLLNVREFGKVRDIDVIGQVDEQTRLVALASNHFIAGWRLDVAAVGRALRQRGILFCLDGIQTLGAFPTPLDCVDILAADAHKWLLGPCAAGIFYVRKSVQDRLHPSVFGWHNVRCPNYVAQEKISFRPDARRYEGGTHNLLGLVGLHAALEVGVEAIASELLRQRAWFVPALQKKGFTVLHAEAPPAHASGITSCFKAGEDMAELHQKLAAAGIVASLRTDRNGVRYLRFSPHFYNTDSDLDRVLQLL